MNRVDVRLQKNGTYIITNYVGDAKIVIIPEDVKGIKITAVDAYAFNNNPYIERIFLPDCIVDINANAFYNCKNLERVERSSIIRKFDTIKVVDEVPAPPITEYGTYVGKSCEILEIIGQDEIIIKIGDEIKKLDYKTVLTKGSLVLDNKKLQEQLLKAIKQQPKEQLYFPHCYGKSAYDIYCELCEKYDFKDVLNTIFLPQRPLFAEYATTPENYDVWFMAHSNWNGSNTTLWDNEIKGNGEYIVEQFIGSSFEYQRFGNPKNNRVTFVKMSDGQYAFLGIYQLIKNDSLRKVRVYERISEVYPE